MRALKILGIVAVVLVVLVGGALAFVATQDFSKYQGVLTEEVRKATGRDLVIKGPLDVSIGLSPAVTVSDVTFQNASWGSRPEMAKIKALDVELQLIPLIMGDVAINRVVLKGADILIETDKQGRNNYDFAPAAAATDGKPPATPAPAAESKPAAAGGPAKIPTIDKLSITDSTVTMRNAQTGQSQTLKLAKLDATGVGSSGATKLDFDGTLNGAPMSAKASIESLAGLLASGNATIDVAVKAGNASATLVGPIRNNTPAGVRIAAQGDSLAGLKPLIGAALPPLGPYSLQGIATGTGKDAYKLDIQALKVGSTEIKGDIAVATEGGKPRLTANLSSPRINAKDFHKDTGTAAKTGDSGGKGDGKVFPADPLPVEDLRLANATVNLRAGEIVNDEVRMQNLVMGLTLANGRLNVKPAATVSGGAVTIDLTLDASGATPALAFALKAQKVSVGDLLKMLQNSDIIKGGPADVDIAVRGAGNSVRAIMASLNGTTSVSVNGGTLNNKNLAFVNADVMKLLGGSGNSTEIRCIVSRFNVVNGLATSQALQFDLSNIYGSGKGTINLGTEGLNMEIDPQTRQSAIASLAVPIDIKGTLANPSVTPDLAKRGTQLLKGAVDNKLGGGGGGGGAGGAVGNIAGTLLGGNKGGGQQQQQQAQAGSGGCGAVAEAQPAAPAGQQPAQQQQRPQQQQPQQQQQKPADQIKRLFR
ncbi:MAG: AsmA family protein [Reyranellaceae bacterium]